MTPFLKQRENNEVKFIYSQIFAANTRLCQTAVEILEICIFSTRSRRARVCGMDGGIGNIGRTTGEVGSSLGGIPLLGELGVEEVLSEKDEEAEL